LCALGGAEVDVAGAEGEAVGVANDGADDDFDREQQIGGHAAENGDLGGVFLAEEGAVGLGGDEELGDDGGNSAEVAGAGCAVEAVAQAFYVDDCGCACRIKVFDRWSKDCRGAFRFG
jgi:hypothetical protein